MKPLGIVWQRLVNTGGQTCDRCGATYDSLQRAIAKLKDTLGPLGLEPKLETREEWLGATVGESRCCSVCGESECRTVEIAGTVFEAIPEELILKAALVAAAQMLGPSSEAVPNESKHGSGGRQCCEGSG
jgi:hypothetical protein